MTPEIFRQHYPQGGIVSELTAIEHGQYVVRVLLQSEGVTLASGLAAASTVEQAEDQARSRAFGIFVPGTAPAAKTIQTAIAPPTQVIPSVPVPAPIPASIAMPVPVPAPIPATASAPTPVPPPSATSYKFDLPLSAPPEPDLIIEEPAPSVTPIVEEALDFSDIIARSDVELKRLGWTSEQGRNYLLETYGKRSRQLLSDEELLEFLRHLEGQPTP